jgi:fused signal recognition particle receptor
MQWFQYIFDFMGIARSANLGDVCGFLAMFFLFLVSAITLLSSLSMTLENSTDTALDNKTDIKSEKPMVESKLEVVAPTISWATRLSLGLGRSREQVWGKVVDLFKKDNLSEEERESLEEILYASDLSPKLVDELMSYLKGNEANQDSMKAIFEFLKSKLAPVQNARAASALDKNSDGSTKLIMIVGVNGAGKTTTIGKLATRLQRSGAKVVVGACDTFRAAAIEQLEVWCQRAGVEMIKASHGADPSGVAYETYQKAKAQGADYCIIDTAGRLHNNSNLMEELKKTQRVLTKIDAKAPHEVFLVVDAITGQNALRQADEFNKALNLTGLIFTKCDGSAKAGAGVTMVDNLKVPIVLIGVGEHVDDLDQFDADQYLNALLGIA